MIRHPHPEDIEAFAVINDSRGLKYLIDVINEQIVHNSKIQAIQSSNQEVAYASYNKQLGIVAGLSTVLNIIDSLRNELTKYNQVK